MAAAAGFMSRQGLKARRLRPGCWAGKRKGGDKREREKRRKKRRGEEGRLGRLNLSVNFVFGDHHCNSRRM